MAWLCRGAIRDGGVDPANLGKGEWIYSVRDATNRMGGHVSTVTNLSSMMQWYRSQGIRFLMVKAATSDYLYNGCQGAPQFNTALVNAARAHGIFIFGYNRSYGSNILGEIAISDFVFQQGADGFVWDAEAEWETLPQNPWITNAAVQAWALCSAVRSNWPTKFLAHAPFPIISLHSSFPYKEFGYWSDAVMPQIYHFSSTGIRRSPSAAINWSDVNWHKWHNDMRALAPSVIGGTTIYWTNAIKPIAPVHDVYGATGALLCNGSAPAHADKDVMEFMDYLSSDPNTPSAGGYAGVSFWRADLHSLAQWMHIGAGTIGSSTGVVNNIVLDDSAASFSGGWTNVRTFSATTTASTFHGATGSDTNSFGTNYWAKGRGTGSASAVFAPIIQSPGEYNLYQWHPYRADASTNVPFVVSHAFGTTTVYANQSTNDGRWSFMGRFTFEAGGSGSIRVTDGLSNAASVAVVDGVKLSYVGPPSVPAAPAGLFATAISGSQISLAWTDAAMNETGFIILRSTTAGGPFTNVATRPANSTNFLDTGLPFGTAFYYRVRATNFAGQSTASNLGTATTLNPPQIVTQPADRSVVAGSNAGFSVSATGTAPLRYRWQFEGVEIAGATNSVFIRSNAQPAHAGLYSVVVTNAAGAAVSSNAALSVLVSPSIVSHPVSQTIRINSNASITVSAAGTLPLSYQWHFNGADLPGQHGSNIWINSAQTNDSGAYYVVVTNMAGAATSSTAQLSVRIPEPSQITAIVAFTNKAVRLDATGEAGVYAVEASTNLAAWSDWATATNATGTFQVTRPTDTNATPAFYRLRLLP